MGEPNAWFGFSGLAELHATEELEIELLLEAVYQRFGFDFRGYARPRLRDRLLGLMRARGLATISGLQERVLHEAGAAQDVVRALGVAKAGLFDLPEDTRRLRSHPTPTLRIKLWTAPQSGPATPAGAASPLRPA